MLISNLYDLISHEGRKQQRNKAGVSLLSHCVPNEQPALREKAFYVFYYSSEPLMESHSHLEVLGDVDILG